MKPAVYRLHQFLHYWRNAPLNPAAQSRVDSILPTPALRALFRQMSPGEQAHSMNVLERIVAHYPAAPPELLQAALLHDVGKTRAPLNMADRVLGVLGQTLFPNRWARWKHKTFVVAVQHAEWGAALAAQAGAAPLTITLIRRHQMRLSGPTTIEDELLKHLQAADDLS